MTTGGTTTDDVGATEALDSGSHVAEQVHRWSEMCFQFRKWERQHILLIEPSPEDQEFHKRNLKWLLRWSRLMHAMIADVDFPDRALAQEFSGLVSQLESSWRMIYEPMPEKEADKLLKEVFPDEP
jgi:hypothetical protein